MTSRPFIETRVLEGDILVVLVRGALDSTTTEEFGQEINKHLDEGWSKIIIDGRYLGFLSSMGIGRLVTLQKRLRQQGGRVKLASLQGKVADVIRQSGLGELLEIYGDLEFAREAFHEDEVPQSRSLRRRIAWSVAVTLVLCVGVWILVKLVGFRGHDSKIESVDGLLPPSENIQQSESEGGSTEEFGKAYVDED